MKSTHKLVAGIFCVLLGAAGAQPAGAQPAKINKCKTITETGSYVVTKNLFATGDCLLVNASYVEIDLGGFTLAGDGTGSGVTDSSNPPVDFAGIDVRNGTITNFQNGIDLDAPQNVVEDVRVIDNVGDGIHLAGSSIVTGNIAQGNGGIGINTGGASSVTRNTSSRNGSHGINAGSSVVVGNNCRLNDGDGIRALGAGAVISGNQSSGNDGNGISASNAVVRENGVISNDADGISASCPSSIVGNTATNSTGSNIVTFGVGCVLADNATN